MPSMATTRLNGEALDPDPAAQAERPTACEHCGTTLAPAQSSLDCATCWHLLFHNHAHWLTLMGLV